VRFRITPTVYGIYMWLKVEKQMTSLEKNKLLV
jgi:hypothetical protein